MSLCEVHTCNMVGGNLHVLVRFIHVIWWMETSMSLCEVHTCNMVDGNLHVLV